MKKRVLGDALPVLLRSPGEPQWAWDELDGEWTLYATCASLSMPVLRAVPDPDADVRGGWVVEVALPTAWPTVLDSALISARSGLDGSIRPESSGYTAHDQRYVLERGLTSAARILGLAIPPVEHTMAGPVGSKPGNYFPAVGQPRQ